MEQQQKKNLFFNKILLSFSKNTFLVDKQLQNADEVQYTNIYKVYREKICTLK